MGVTSPCSFHGLPICQEHDLLSHYLCLVESILNSPVHTYNSVSIFLFIKTSHRTQPLNYSWSKPEKKSFTFIDFTSLAWEINKLRKWLVHVTARQKTGAEPHLFFFFFNIGYIPCVVQYILVAYFIYLFIYFWLRLVFVAAHGISLVAVSGGYSLLPCTGFSLRWLLLLQSPGAGFSSCASWALERRLSSCGARA